MRSSSSEIEAEKFYRQPCWFGIWAAHFDTEQLAFWSRIDEASALTLLNHLENFGFVKRRVINGRASGFEANPTYYSQLEFYSIKQKNSLPIPTQDFVSENTATFYKSCQKLWNSMRILRTFSIGQLKACSEVNDRIARTWVSQLYQVNYIFPMEYYPKYFKGNEDVYQLIQNTGPKAPLICADGVLYDMNAHRICRTLI